MSKLNDRIQEESVVVNQSTIIPKLRKGDRVFYAQIFKPPLNTYEVIELKLHTINDIKQYFTGFELRGDKHTYLFGYHCINDIIFFDRKDALEKVKAAEQQYKNYHGSNEVEYEEY